MPIKQEYINRRTRGFSGKMSGQEAALKMHEILRETSTDKRKFNQKEEKNKIKVVAEHLGDDRFLKKDKVVGRREFSEMVRQAASSVRGSKQKEFLNRIESFGEENKSTAETKTGKGGGSGMFGGFSNIFKRPKRDPYNEKQNQMRGSRTSAVDEVKRRGVTTAGGLLGADRIKGVSMSDVSLDEIENLKKPPKKEEIRAPLVQVKK